MPRSRNAPGATTQWKPHRERRGVASLLFPLCCEKNLGSWYACNRRETFVDTSFQQVVTPPRRMHYNARGFRDNIPPPSPASPHNNTPDVPPWLHPNLQNECQGFACTQRRLVGGVVISGGSSEFFTIRAAAAFKTSMSWLGGVSCIHIRQQIKKKKTKKE